MPLSLSLILTLHTHLCRYFLNLLFPRFVYSVTFDNSLIPLLIYSVIFLFTYSLFIYSIFSMFTYSVNHLFRYSHIHLFRYYTIQRFIFLSSISYFNYIPVPFVLCNSDEDSDSVFCFPWCNQIISFKIPFFFFYFPIIFFIYN